MMNREMKVEEKYSDITLYFNEEKNLRIAVAECNSRFGTRQMYSVRLVDVDPATGKANSGETVATRCTYDQAMRIAREHYFA